MFLFDFLISQICLLCKTTFTWMITSNSSWEMLNTVCEVALLSVRDIGVTYAGNHIRRFLIPFISYICYPCSIRSPNNIILLILLDIYLFYCQYYGWASINVTHWRFMFFGIYSSKTYQYNAFCIYSHTTYVIATFKSIAFILPLWKSTRKA